MKRDPGGYEPPPTQRDTDMSAVHHSDSVVHNLRHGLAHIQEALGHARAQQDRMSSNPRFQPHADALNGRMEQREQVTGRDMDQDNEQDEPRDLGRVMGDDGRGKSLERMGRKFGRVMSRRGGTRG